MARDDQAPRTRGARRLRRPTALDVGAALLARAAPRWATPRIDTARHDARALLEALRGRRPPPTIDRRWFLPPPLSSVDPLTALLPRGLAERVDRTRQDLRMVGRALRGERAPGLVERGPATRPAVSGGRAEPRSTGLAFRSLRVTKVIRETAEATTLELQDVAGAPLHYLPGQFLTLELEVGGEKLRRAYSLSTAPGEGPPSLTIKRLSGGRASGRLTRDTHVGEVFRALGPSGSFTVEPHRAAGTLLLVSGGSGITPLRAIAHAVLAQAPDSRVFLVYGNRREQDIIFHAALEGLARRHPERFVLDLVLEEPPEGFSGGVGRLDRATLEERLSALGLLPADADLACYLCGPDAMREAARELLGSQGVPIERIHEEIFLRPAAAAAPEVPSDPQRVTYVLDGSERELEVRPGETLLEAGLRGGVPMGFSCAMGGCGTCRVHLLEGRVRMDEPNCLRPGEQAEGLILPCVARPLQACRLEARR